MDSLFEYVSGVALSPSALMEDCVLGDIQTASTGGGLALSIEFNSP
jgi:hypothetical protein